MLVYQRVNCFLTGENMWKPMDTDTYFQTERNLPTRVNITAARIRYVDGKRMIRWMSRIDFDDSAWWLIPLSKWVITPVINGISRVNPLITGVITHLLSGMSHQVDKYWSHFLDVQIYETVTLWLFNIAMGNNPFIEVYLVTIVIFHGLVQ